MNAIFIPRFQFRNLRFFIASAELGSIRHAARTLSLDVGTVSRGIRDLEDEIGAALFIRGHAGVRLTCAGGRFLERARNVLNQMHTAMQDLSAIGRGEEGVVRLGLVTSMASGFIDELLKAYIANYAGVRIEYIEGEAADHVQLIKQCRMDVAFLTGTPAADGCDTAHLWNERIYVAMSEKHELAGKAEINWTDLQDQVFIVSEAQSGREIYDYLVKNLAKAGYSPSIQQQAVYRDTLMQIVAGESNLTLTSEATIAAQFPGVAYRPLAHELLPFCAVWSPRNDNPAFRRLLSLARVISKRHEVSTVKTAPVETAPNVLARLVGAPSQNLDQLQ